jgi:4-hydroxy-2-oxoheptanedioate aldolase
MIETRAAIENMEDILSVPGVAGVYVGPSDLGFSYGLAPKLDREEPEILAIYAKLLREAGKRGVFCGIHCGSAAYAARAIKMGFRLTSLMNDSGLMAMAAKAAIAEVRRDGGGIA